MKIRCHTPWQAPRRASRPEPPVGRKQDSKTGRAVTFSVAGAGLLGLGTLVQLNTLDLSSQWKLGLSLAAAVVGGVGGLVAGLQDPRPRGSNRT